MQRGDVPLNLNDSEEVARSFTLTNRISSCQNPSSPGFGFSARSREEPQDSKDQTMPDPPIPTVVAMLVCDQIITEAGTNKRTLIGVFDRYRSFVFPAMLPRLAVYVKLADAEGNYLFKLRLVQLKDESLHAEISIQAQITDSTQYVEVALNFGNIPLPEPGKYELQLYAGDIYLHRVTMQAEIAQPPQGG